MRALVLIHRWLGVALCLFFAMWFASGMAMHFVPFPALTARPALRTLLIVVLCAAGFAFSTTGVVIAWCRLRQTI